MLPARYRWMTHFWLVTHTHTPQHKDKHSHMGRCHFGSVPFKGPCIWSTWKQSHRPWTIISHRPLPSRLIRPCSSSGQPMKWATWTHRWVWDAPCITQKPSGYLNLMTSHDFDAFGTRGKMVNALALHLFWESDNKISPSSLPTWKNIEQEVVPNRLSTSTTCYCQIACMYTLGCFLIHVSIVLWVLIQDNPSICWGCVKLDHGELRNKHEHHILSSKALCTPCKVVWTQLNDVEFLAFCGGSFQTHCFSYVPVVDM